MASWYRILRSAQVTLSQRFTVDEVPTDATGPVTVDVKRLDGTTVTSGTATHPGELGLYTFAPPAQPLVDIQTVDWTGTFGGVPIVIRDIAEIVGGFVFDLGTARTRYKLPVAKYSVAHLSTRRTQVEQECEAICFGIAGGRLPSPRAAWVPRFARVTVSGRGTRELLAPHLMVRTIRAVQVAGIAWSQLDVSAVTVSSSGVLTRLFNSPWPVGAQNITLEYEYGMDLPPTEISEAAMYRLRSLLSAADTIIDERAISYNIADGGVYRLSTPSAKRTGVPSIDAVYERNGLSVGAFA